MSDSDTDYAPYPGDEHQPDDLVWVDFIAENTGEVPLEPMLCAEYANGVVYQRADYSVMDPEETRDDSKGTLPIGKFITPGTDTAELLGTVTLTFWYDGLDPETGEKLCESNKISRTWKVLKDGTTTTGDPGELKPALSVTIWADPGAGDGKRYVDAQVIYHYEVTNTGNCPVYVPWWPDYDTSSFDASAPNGRTDVAGMGWGYGVALLNPGETYTEKTNYDVNANNVESGYISLSSWGNAWYYDTEGKIQYFEEKSNGLTIPLTYPKDGDPDPDVAKLEIVWNYDEIWDDSMDLQFDTTGPGVLEAVDGAWAYFDVINAGNVPLEVYTYAVWDNGKPDEYSPWWLNTLNPGKTDWDYYGAEPLGDWITPGTDTAELSGTVTVTFWAVGFDPETGEQLCETEHLSRTWQVRKPGPKPWDIPEESSLTVSISEYDTSNDPAGYQLTEWWDTAIHVRNEGPVDVPEYTLHVDVTADNSTFVEWTDIDATDGATWYEETFSDGIAPAAVDNRYYWSPDGSVAAGDVTRGYVQVSAYVTWIDPDSEKPRESNHDTVYLPVISKTGLLLKKGIEKGPANEHYFEEGEPILWTLTVTNTSSEPIYNVVVMDQGVKVGEFPVINPGETLPCAVPPHVVTDYEADVAMTVVNIATATGEDLQGAEHTWISNPVSVPTNEFSPVPIPPVTPPEDPGKTPEDPGPGKPIDPPTEDPWKDKEKDKDGAPFIKGDGGDSCLLTLTALSDAEARYTLHACAEHLAAAQAAQEATANSPDAGWDQAAEIWRAEIDKLYDALREAAQSDEARAAVTSDQEAYWAYIDAFAAMNGDSPAARKTLAETLRLRCAELCCMLHTAPEPLPDSLLGDYASMMNAPAADETSRAFGPLNGSDCEVTVKLNAGLAEAMGNALAIVRGSKSMYAAKTFATAQAQWQMTLDAAANAAYKAADRDGKKLIAAWRMSVDQLIAARTALLNLLYADAPDVTEEALMNLYKNAAIDAEMMK